MTNISFPAEKRAASWAFGLASAWALFVLFSYFTSPAHPWVRVLPFYLGVLRPEGPGDPSVFWEVQLGSLRVLGTGLYLAWGTYALGCRLRRWLGLEIPDNWVRAAADLGLGILALDLFWLGTGLNGLWFKPVWTVLWLAVLPLAIGEAVHLFGSGKGKGGASFPRGGFLLLAAAGALYALFALGHGLVPETFYDSMVYHLAVPEHWLFRHGLADYPENFFSNYPFGAELFFLNGLVLQGTEAAKLLHLACFGACALAAGGWAREIGGASAGWLSLGFTLTLPLLEINAWTTQVEGPLCLALVLFLYSWVRLLREGKEGGAWALPAGLFLGLALSIKYTAALAGVCALAAVLPAGRGSWKGLGRASLLAGAAGCLILAGPWVLKDLAYTGNPFFPYLMGPQSWRSLPSFGYERLLQEQHARAASGFWEYLRLPWTLVLSRPDDYNFCGPLALALAPFLLLFRLRHPALRFLALFVPLFFVLGWGVTHILRFVLPAFLFLNILLASVLAGGDRPGWGRAAAWTGALCAFLCFGFLAGMSHRYYGAAGLWLGRETRDQYLWAGKLNPYPGLAGFSRDRTPPGSRILAAGDARGLYYGREVLAASVFDDQPLARMAREEKDAEGIAKRLRQRGVDLISVNGPEGIRVSPEYRHYELTSGEWRRLDDFIQRGTQVLYQDRAQALYQVLPSLGQAPKEEVRDLLLLFSPPASRFVRDLREGRALDAAGDLAQVKALYPFSRFWRSQAPGPGADR